MHRCEGLRLALFTDTYTPQVNGVARTLERLVHAVRERGGSVRVFTPEAGGHHDAADVTSFGSIPFWAYPELRLSWPAQRAVQRALRAFRPTLVHAATEFGAGIAGLRAARATGVPFVSSYHTNFTAYAQYYRLGLLGRPGWKFLRWFHNAGLRTYCPSESIRAELEQRNFRNLRVWSRGIDCARFNPSFRSSQLRREMGARDDMLVVLYVGRVAAEKGLDTALDALRIVEERAPGRVRFACVGEGPYAARVRELAPSGSWIPGKLTGDRLSAVYASSDLFLFPSRTDTFGNVLLESMASGVPVVGADVGPTRELVSSNRGWLATSGSADAMAACIMEALDDRAALQVRATNSLVFAQSRSWEQVWDDLIADYLTVSTA